MAIVSRLRLATVCAEVQRPIRYEFGKHYVPVSITSPSPLGRGRQYWQLVDPAFSLVEVGMDATSGQLVEFAVVNYNGTVESAEPRGTVRTLYGMPCFDLSAWSTPTPGFNPHFAQCPGRCSIALGLEGIYVGLFADTIDFEVMMENNVGCAFNANGELVSVRIYQISESLELVRRRLAMSIGSSG